MKRTEGPALGSVLLGVTLLYVAWANAGVLLPPFTCGPEGGAALTIGADLALVYARGCELAAFSHAVFGLVTATGVWAILDGLVGPQNGLEAFSDPDPSSPYRFDEADFDVESVTHE